MHFLLIFFIVSQGWDAVGAFVILTVFNALHLTHAVHLAMADDENAGNTTGRRRLRLLDRLLHLKNQLFFMNRREAQLTIF